MRKKKIYQLLLLFAGMLTSCSTPYLNVRGVAYQSIRANNPTANNADAPNDPKIIVSHIVLWNGMIEVAVKNNTNHIMTIDRTRSFFRNISGNSIPYYDPTVRVNSQSVLSGNTTGASVNLGSIASAAGISGPLGTALGGVNIGGSENNSTTNTNTTYYIDQPQISIAPHGLASMGRAFQVEGIGVEFLSQAVKTAPSDVANAFNPERTYAGCNICISFSTDDGKTYDTIMTDIYANTLIISKVRQTGKVNEALRNIYLKKQDALTENWYLLLFDSDSKSNNSKAQINEFINFK